ncbi:sensor histidine kinase [Saccharomonospora azurea]|uniref:histidine kinase n=1 Tax=Saccharomonospora azurea NA-128 TaxID=882081 RepID=H8G7N4_9PSEU|nr:histidine kinase [Saccharomonospora azurea NA-128]
MGAPISPSHALRALTSDSPNGRALLALACSVVLTGGLWVWASLETVASQRLPLFLVGGFALALLCVATYVATFHYAQLQDVNRLAESAESELTLLVEDILPVMARRLREGASLDTVKDEIPDLSNALSGRIVQLFAKELDVSERQREAAMAACANAAGRVQAMATSMLADLREMEYRHNEDVLGDLLRLDHCTSQAGRLADSIAVLTGARTGRRWTKPIIMESILRGAMGRIGSYQRVTLHSTCTAAVVGYAAEDVMHALAELMDNATKFSKPSESVHVYVEELSSGVVVIVEDAGLGMKPSALERAERAVSTTEPLDLAALSGTRLGLAVVGRLARKHQLRVRFRRSPRGGVSVVVRIPATLITKPCPEDEPTVRNRRPVDDRAVQQAPPAGRLPKRRRGQTLTGSPPPPRARHRAEVKPRADAGARFSAFRTAIRPHTPPTTAD